MSLLLYLFTRIVFVFKPIRIIYDLKIVSKKQRDKLVNKVVEDIRSLDFVEAIIDYGGTKYKPGVSDLDFIIIISDGTNKRDLKILKYIFHQLGDINLHLPIILNFSLFEKFHNNSIFIPNFDLASRRSGARCIYKKKGIRLRLKITLTKDQLALGVLEHIFLRKFFLQYMLKENFKKHISFRWAVKTLDTTIKHLLIFKYYYAEEGINVLYTLEDSQELKHLISMKDAYLYKLDEVHTFNSFELKEFYKTLRTALILQDKILPKIYNKIFLDGISSTSTGGGKVIIERTQWGKIFFISNYFASNAMNLLSLFMERIGVFIYDLNVYKYFFILKNYSSNKFRSTINLKSTIKNRFEIYNEWREFHDNFDLDETSLSPLATMYTDELLVTDK